MFVAVSLTRLLILLSRGWREGSLSLTLLNMFYLREIPQCESLSSVLVCMDELHKLAAHHTPALNWGNWLSREQILPLVNSARCVQPDE